ncbi:MAG: hypothetical protein AAGC80_21715 [Rhodococcus sp. (in: high G+C Gram-positive bacteria)]
MPDHIPGQTVWQELNVHDSTGLAEFYRAVLGWDLTLEGDRGLFTLDGAPVAGLRVSSGSPEVSGWTSYITTNDFDESLRRTELNGGKVLDPAAALTIDGARAAVAQDCFGAVFGFASLPEGSGAPATSELGRLVLADIMTTDITTGQSFWDSVLQRTRTHHEDNLSVYRDEHGAALIGINELTADERAHVPAHVLPWFAVNDDTSAVVAAERHGGTIATQGNTFCFGGWGVVLDPAGAAFKTLRLNTDSI